ncbi:MAG: UDP-N-acetylmuramoyl-L-alanine--D-glutamate ligase [Bdellovibrionales bacterium CG10_big_fil_rev_8_21_14_0_10_45_34]|nr:MAG: UDP-N-acetylmuramoyl-L-alanine--D-glutamate ligase [Bdellovibrionales bacterium CG10_big_fil_rev_8_21_14_0_10_45_34]
MELAEIKDQKIMIVGLGKTGVAMTRFLSQAGAQVTVSDHKSPAELAEALEEVENLENVQFDLGGHTPKSMLGQDLIILSPGVSPELKLFQYVRQHGVRTTSEIEFVSQFINEPVIAIAGTNGKTTTGKTIELMLTQAGKKVWFGGATNTPLVDYLLSGEKADLVIVEIPSFQLEMVERFNPINIVFTNISEAHLDRYKGFEEYVRTQRRVFQNVQVETTSILNADENLVVDMARDPAVQRGRIFYFSKKASLEPQIMNIGGCVNIGKEIRVRLGPEIEYYNVKSIKMRGRHSTENIMAAICIARTHGATPEIIQNVMETFSGLPHRLEYVRRVGGVEFFNDSKATNVQATRKALESFDENVILIAGGKDSNQNFAKLEDLIRLKVKTLILIGEAKERINREIGDFTETFLIGTFEEAVLIAYQKSRIGDTVLLSPGSPSFDIFDSYEERGNYFKKLVNEFK